MPHVTGRVEIHTRDADLGLTLLLWTEDLLADFLARQPEVRVVIDDDGVAGRPLRNGLMGGVRGDCRVLKGQQEVRLLCSSSVLFLRRRPLVEAARKALVRLGQCHDMTSINHARVINQQRRVREAVRRGLSVATPEPACRFLVRVDDFPSPAANLDDFLRFHQVAAESGVPYLLAVTPFLGRGAGRDSLSQAEAGALRRCAGEGVELALHGFTHRSRYRNYASELASLPGPTLRAELGRAEDYLRQEGLGTVGFVAPFNSYDALTLSVLTEHYKLICGGPESVLSLGYRAGPSFLMRSLYAPSYRGAYDLTADGLAGLDHLRRQAAGLVVPLTLHWANEVRDGFRSFRALCARLTGSTRSWSDYLTFVDRVKSVAAADASLSLSPETPA